MQKNEWSQVISSSAEPARVKAFLARLEATSAASFLTAASPQKARVISSLVAGSQAAAETLAQHPEWLALPWSEPEYLAHPRQKQGLLREIEPELGRLLAAKDYAGTLRYLRQFKQQEMIRIAARDLARLGNTPEIIGEISNVADVCLEWVWRTLFAQLTERWGTPWHRDAEGHWRPTPFCVMGLGKLGGQELNYSSDVDVIFVYEEEGFLFRRPPAAREAGGTGLTNHQFFTRFAEAFMAEVGRMAPEGRLFRIDLRLRPEGNAGPLARSLGSYENYYWQWGQTWERMMLIKARGVAGDVNLAGEFLEMAQPFRFPRSLGERVFREVAAMKRRIEAEVIKSGELDRNVKLGRGGIREIEFIAQTLQVIHAGKTPFLQGGQTLEVLEKLVQYRFLEPGEARGLAAAYVFLRDVEHRLQMEADRQTHTVPEDAAARARLARLMGFDTVAAFEAAWRAHSRQVRQVYDQVLGTEASPAADGLPGDFEQDKEAWLSWLAGHSFSDPAQAWRLLYEFVHGPGYIHVSPHTVELARELLPKIFARCPVKGKAAPAADLDSPDGEAARARVLSDPDRVLARLDSYISAYGARATLFELWTANHSLFELLILLFDRSEFLAEIAVRSPELVDDLELSGRLRRVKSAEETLRDLRYGLADADQHQWMRRYYQAEFLRLGLRSILGLTDFEQNIRELTALADACLQYALEVVLRRHRLKKAPFAIIGLGKLGGEELTYGSDLDLLFVSGAQSKNARALGVLAAQIMDLLSAKTEHGAIFETDARLRPDGEKGLLVSPLPVCEEYYRNRAMLWEIQTLTRARWVAGHAEIGRKFMALAGELADFKTARQPVAARTPGWRQGIAKMRHRIETERVPAGRQHLAFKTGAGGLMDAEFIAQTLCLEQGWHEPNTLRALRRAQAEGKLSEPGVSTLITNYRRLWRIECVLRRWSYLGESELPAEAAPQRRVAIRCGYEDAEALLAAVAACRGAIRGVYSRVLP
jgi:[glutamine synthetase] adenylyltransferase / [glutamine synthetase]-adenylyl-L-tyrosine phosphorylase